MRFYYTVLITTSVALAGIFITGRIITDSYDKFKSKVIEVIDGDTVKIEDGSLIRLLGIDAPETNHPDLSPQRFGEEAKEYLKKRILNKVCIFEYDKNNKFDIYNRILAFVYLDGKLINAEMIKNGYAYVYLKSKNKKTNEFLMLEDVARKQKKGLWSLSIERSIKDE